jgi:regulator of protease activity HflC (stomatin/prohibitin superfamily)
LRNSNKAGRHHPPTGTAAFGIAIEQVGLKRIALPEANTLYVFERIKAERGNMPHAIARKAGS